MARIIATMPARIGGANVAQASMILAKSASPVGVSIAPESCARVAPSVAPDLWDFVKSLSPQVLAFCG
jgi:hypothetical protein